MLVDRATLSDLSILDPGDEGASLYSLLDKTRTRLGSRALRGRMRIPPTRTELRVNQDAVRYLSSRVAPAQRLLESLGPDAVEQYLGLKWQALTKSSRTGRFLERAVLRVAYGDAVRQISVGVRAVGKLVDGLRNVVGEFATGSLMLEHYGTRLRELTESEPIAAIHRHVHQRSLASLLEADRLARGVARDALLEILTIVAEIDALTALAAATVEYQWCFPELVESDGIVDFIDLRHPFLPAGAPNDVHLEGHRVLALTGPNMAGKSTLLKATGTAVYLAHLGCGVPASRARLSCFDALLAALSVRDSLSSGQSFYLSEVRRIKDLLTTLESTPKVFALLDEPFKGTNVLDATEATELLIDGLCAQVASTVVMTTHLSSVVESRAHDERLKTSFLGAIEGATDLSFDYVLRDGVSGQRLGMVLLQREGVGRALALAIERRSAAAVAERGA